jgi:anti-sigma factor RsiW
MHCDEAEILLHGLLDNETDTSAVGTHVAICSRCAAQLQQFLALRELFRERDLHVPAPLALRRTVLATLREPTAKAAERLKLLMGFGSGAAFSTLAAVFVMIAVIRSDQDAAITSDVLSAHLRSLDSTHVADVVTGDPKELKPWFSRRLGSEPPIPDLRSRGLDLIGGRIDFVLGKAVAAIVYRRGDHLINVFVAEGGEEKRVAKIHALRGFNVALWSERNLKLCAVGDVGADELRDIGKSFATSMSSAPI